MERIVLLFINRRCSQLFFNHGVLINRNTTHWAEWHLVGSLVSLNPVIQTIWMVDMLLVASQLHDLAWRFKFHGTDGASCISHRHSHGLTNSLSHAISELINSGSICLSNKVLLVCKGNASLSYLIKIPVELDLFSSDLMVLKEVTFFLNGIDILERD